MAKFTAVVLVDGIQGKSGLEVIEGFVGRRSAGPSPFRRSAGV